MLIAKIGPNFYCIILLECLFLLIWSDPGGLSTIVFGDMPMGGHVWRHADGCVTTHIYRCEYACCVMVGVESEALTMESEALTGDFSASYIHDSRPLYGGVSLIMRILDVW